MSASGVLPNMSYSLGLKEKVSFFLIVGFDVFFPFNLTPRKFNIAPQMVVGRPSFPIGIRLPTFQGLLLLNFGRVKCEKKTFGCFQK